MEKYRSVFVITRAISPLYLHFHLSHIFKIRRAVEFYSIDNIIDYELVPGCTLSLPVRFDGRVGQLGVYLGPQSQDTGNYSFQLEDEIGAVLGKTELSRDATENTEFIYINAKGNADSRTQYNIKNIFGKFRQR